MGRKIAKTAMEIAAVILIIAALWYASNMLFLNSRDDDAIKWWLSFSNFWLLGMTVLLAVGLFGEFPETKSWKDSILYSAAKWAVIVGVMGELLGNAGIFETSRYLQIIEDKRLERIKLPRLFRLEDQITVSDSVKSFPNIGYDIALNCQSAEQQGFADRLELALHWSGWKAENWPEPDNKIWPRHPDVGCLIPVEGVAIQMTPPTFLKFELAANALVVALKSLDIEARVEPDQTVPNNRTDVMHIIIGAK